VTHHDPPSPRTPQRLGVLPRRPHRRGPRGAPRAPHRRRRAHLRRGARAGQPLRQRPEVRGPPAGGARAARAAGRRRLRGGVLRDPAGRGRGHHGQPPARRRADPLLLRVHRRAYGAGGRGGRSAFPRSRPGGAPPADAPRGGRPGVHPRAGRRRWGAGPVAHASGRSGDLAFQRRNHRPPQGRGAAPPLVREHHRTLWQGHPGDRPRRRHPLRPQALLRIRHRDQPALPLQRRRHRRAVPGAVHCGQASGPDRGVPPHHPGQRPDDGEPPPGAPRRGRAGPVVAAPVHLGGGGAPRGAAPPLERDLRRAPAGRPRHVGDVAHLHLQPPRRRAPGHPRQGRARLRRGGARRRRTPAAHRRGGAHVGARRLPRPRLLAPPREDRGGVPGRVVRLGRHDLHRRRGVGALPGARGRHAEGERAVAQPPRARGLPPGTPRGARSRGGGCRGRAGARQAPRLRDPGRRRGAGPGAGGIPAVVGAGEAGAVQHLGKVDRGKLARG